MDFVIDRYPAISTKFAEREKRASGGVQAYKIYNQEQDVPKQWKKFLSLGRNKENLTEFLFENWCKQDPSALDNLDVFITHREFCHKLTNIDDKIVVTTIPELTSDHEEADTRLLLHARHAVDNGITNVVIKSPDTDVFVIAMSSSLKCKLFFQTGTGNNHRIISVDHCRTAFGAEWSKALIGFHIFTAESWFSCLLVFLFM